MTTSRTSAIRRKAGRKSAAVRRAKGPTVSGFSSARERKDFAAGLMDALKRMAGRTK